MRSTGVIVTIFATAFTLGVLRDLVPATAPAINAAASLIVIAYAVHLLVTLCWSTTKTNTRRRTRFSR